MHRSLLPRGLVVLASTFGLIVGCSAGSPPEGNLPPTKVATPEEFVIAVFAPPAKVTLGPVPAGAVKVTVAFATALSPASVTVATSGEVKAVLTWALCPVPAVTAMLAGAPAAFARTKAAVVAVPEDATTL